MDHFDVSMSEVEVGATQTVHRAERVAAAAAAATLRAPTQHTNKIHPLVPNLILVKWCHDLSQSPVSRSAPPLGQERQQG